MTKFKTSSLSLLSGEAVYITACRPLHTSMMRPGDRSLFGDRIFTCPLPPPLPAYQSFALQPRVGSLLFGVFYFLLSASHLQMANRPRQPGVFRSRFPSCSSYPKGPSLRYSSSVRLFVGASVPPDCLMAGHLRHFIEATAPPVHPASS